jgi:hypothetical protein
MKNQFWAGGCGLGWSVKKRGWADHEQLLVPVFSLFRGQKKFSVRTEKVHRKKVKKIFFGGIFFSFKKTIF